LGTWRSACDDKRPIESRIKRKLKFEEQRQCNNQKNAHCALLADTAIQEGFGLMKFDAVLEDQA
jgi:hypothetical protein